MNARLANLSNKMTERLGKLTKGAAAVEYPLLVVLISIVLIPALVVFGPALGRIFNRTASSLTATGSGETSVTCVDGDNSNGYFNNMYWLDTTEYSWGDAVYISGGEPFTDGTVAAWVLAQAKEEHPGLHWVFDEGDFYNPMTGITTYNYNAHGQIRTPETPQNWARYSVNPPSGAVQFATPPAGADLSCPVDPNACVSGDNSNGYFNNWYWTKRTDYFVPSNPVGNSQLAGTEVITSSGATWEPGVNWDYSTGEGIQTPVVDADGAPYTKASAIAAGAYEGSASWSGSQTDDGGAQYGTPPDVAYATCPSGGGGGVVVG